MARQGDLRISSFTGATTYTLSPPAGKSYLVRDICIRPSSTDWLTVRIDRTTVGYFWARAGGLGGQLCNRKGNPDSRTLLARLYDEGLWTGYPVGEGQTLSLSISTAGGLYGYVVYEEGEAGKFTPTQPNGSEAKEYTYLNYGVVSGGTTIAGDNRYNKSVNPSEFPDFPFGGVVPSGTEIDLLGICASDRCMTGSTASDYIATVRYYWLCGREHLFDPTRTGLIAWGFPATSANTFTHGTDISVSGMCSDTDQRMPYLFDPPVTFGPGEEVNIYVVTREAGNGGTLTEENTTIALILRAREVS